MHTGARKGTRYNHFLVPVHMSIPGNTNEGRDRATARTTTASESPPISHIPNLPPSAWSHLYVLSGANRRYNPTGDFPLRYPPVSLYAHNPYTGSRYRTSSTLYHYPVLSGTSRNAYAGSRYSTRKLLMSQVSDKMYFNLNGKRLMSHKIRNYWVYPSVFARKAYVDVEVRI